MISTPLATAPPYGSEVVICEPMCMCIPIIETLGIALTASASRSERAMSMPNFVSFLPVAMYRCVLGSTSGLTRSAIGATRPASAATRAMASSSASLSTLNISTPASRPARISSSVLPTPAKTTRSPGPPASPTRYSSPPETTSNPLPCSAITLRMPRFEFALTE